MFAALAGFDQPFNQLAIAAHRAGRHPVGAVCAQAVGHRAPRDGGVVPADLRLGAHDLPASLHRYSDGTAAGRVVPLGVAVCRRRRRALDCKTQWQWTRDPARWRLAALYAAGALLLCAVAFVIGGWALWLLWGSVSLLLVALAYAAIGAGRVPESARTVACPWQRAGCSRRTAPGPGSIRARGHGAIRGPCQSPMACSWGAFPRRANSLRHRSRAWST